MGFVTGVIVFVSFIGGIVTWAFAASIMGVVGKVMAAVSVILAIFSIVMGAVQRRVCYLINLSLKSWSYGLLIVDAQDLRNGIRDLWHDRAQLHLYVEQMRVITDFAVRLGEYINMGLLKSRLEC